MVSSTLQNLKKDYQNILLWLSDYLDLIEINRPIYENCKNSFGYFPSYSYLELVSDSLQEKLARTFARLVEAKFIELNSTAQIKPIWEQFLIEEGQNIKNVAQVAKVEVELLFQNLMGR